MKKRNGQVYTRDESQIKFIPTICIPLLVLSIFAVLLLTILCVLSAIHHNWTSLGCEAGGIVLLLIFGRICDGLDWHHHAQFVIDGNHLSYYYDLDSRVLPTSRTEVCMRFHKVTKLEKTSKDEIKVYGDIEKRAPMSKPSMIHKFVIKGFGKDTDAIMDALRAKA